MKKNFEDNNIDNELNKTDNILQNLSIDEVNRSITSCNDGHLVNYQARNQNNNYRGSFEEEMSMNENNQSKYSNLLDNSFVKINSKIDEFKNSIKEKIRIMKSTNLAQSNYSKNKQTSNIEAISRNEYSNYKISSSSNSHIGKSYLNSNYDHNTHSQCQSNNDFVIYNSFRKILDKKAETSPIRESNEYRGITNIINENKIFEYETIQNNSQKNNDEEKKDNNNTVISPIQRKSNIVDTLEYRLSEDITNNEKTIRSNTLNNNFVTSIEKDFNEIDKNMKTTKHSIKTVNETLREKGKYKEKNRTKYSILMNKYRRKRRELKETKNSLNKLRRITQFLKYKNYFEFVKQNSLNSNSNQGANSMKTTQICDEKEDKKMNKKLLTKLEENIKIFEQLENEIVSKDKLITNLNLIIDSQKKTIDKLVEHYDLIYKNTQNEDLKLTNDFMKIVNFGSSFEQSLIKVEHHKEDKIIQNTLMNSIPDKEGKFHRDPNCTRTIDKKQNSMYTMSYNLSKSNDDKADIPVDDCSVFLSSQKGKVNITETTSQIQEEKSLKLADLTCYENLKKNSFLESNYNYKLTDSCTTPCYNENLLKNS